jgi:hypothetical protein
MSSQALSLHEQYAPLHSHDNWRFLSALHLGRIAAPNHKDFVNDGGTIIDESMISTFAQSISNHWQGCLAGAPQKEGENYRRNIPLATSLQISYKVILKGVANVLGVHFDTSRRRNLDRRGFARRTLF